jgi:chemotaxis response regulator CheB
MRVLLATPPGLLRDLLRHILTGSSDVVVLVEPDWAKVASAVKETQPDVLIVRRPSRGSVRQLRPVFEVAPLLRVLAVGVDGREAVLYEMRPHAVLVGELSPQVLLDVVHQPTQAWDEGSTAV